MAGRYDAEGPEAESEPGSRGRVLRNRVGITSVREIERRESEALLEATQATIDETRIDQRLPRRISNGCIDGGWAKFMCGQVTTDR